MITLFAAVIAVLGTLAGVAVTSSVQLRAATAQRLHVQGEARRAELIAAVSELAAALADHRGSMFLREQARLSGKPDAVALALLSDRVHETRSAMTAPATTVTMLAPQLREAAQRAVQATYNLRHASDQTSLGQLRGVALKASDDLVEQAGRLVAE